MNILDIGHTKISKRNDGIVRIVASNRNYSIMDIQDIHATVNQINDGQKALLLLIADNYTTIDNAARQFLSTPEAGKHSIAEAYVIKSLAQRLILNFLIRVNGTPVPSRFFTDANEAEKWLLTFKTNTAGLEENELENEIIK